MNIEKPISTIKKAIEGKDERNTLDKPKENFIDSSEKPIVFFQKMKKTWPNEIEKIILNYAEDKEIRDLMGVKLYNLFNTKWQEEMKFAFNAIVVNGSYFLEEYFKKNDVLSKENYNDAFYNISKEVLEEMAIEFIEYDSEIINAFSEKKDILKRAIDNRISGYIQELKTNFYYH